MFTQEPYRISSQASRPPAFRHPAEIQQYSVPPPLPSLGNLHTLPPLRPEADDVEYKFRRPSLPASPDHQPTAPVTRFVAPLPTNSPVEDRGTQYRPGLACTYPGSLRDSASNFDQSSSTVGVFQQSPDTTGPDDNIFAYTSQATATPQVSHNNYAQISLPPPAQLFRPEAPTELFAVRTTEDSTGAIGSSRVDLAPLHSLQRRPYRREPVDDMALRSLGPRSG